MNLVADDKSSPSDIQVKGYKYYSFFCVSDAAFLYENVISGSSGGGKTDIDRANKEATAVMFRRHNRFWQVESVWNKCLN